MNVRYSIMVASCLAVLLSIALLAPKSDNDSRVRASAPNAKATPTISKQMNAGRVGNVQAARTPAANKLVPLDSNAQMPASVIPDNFWKKGGNAGTNPASNFIGTTDNAAFEVRVNNRRALRVQPDDNSPNLIGGFDGNTITAGVRGGTIGGGGQINFVNRVTDSFGTVAGGDNNQAGDNTGTTGNGGNTVGGGLANTASGLGATVGGGETNLASGPWATVSGGGGNLAEGTMATVPGGRDNSAGGDYSFAAGHRAKLADTADGSFMFADSNDFDFNSNLANAFRVRVTGGARFVVGIDGSGNPTWSCTLTDGNSWSCSSDRNLKENFQPVDARGVLEKLAHLPVVRWNARGQDPRVKHLGPMAQDFYAAFGLGDDDKSISTIDLDGVALVSIQALYEMLRADETRFEAQEQRIQALEAQNAAFAARLKALEAKK